MKGRAEPVLASIDVGTSTVRCILINKNAEIKGQSKANVNLLYPEPGFVEIDPEALWETVVNVVKNAVHDSNLKFGDIHCFGISCQRNSFLLWNKVTNVPYHNFIAWNDIRGETIVKDENNSFKLKLFRCLSKLLYIIIRRKRFLVGSMFKLTNPQITPRLLWLLKNLPKVKRDIDKNNVAFGTIDTWLLYKLSGGLLHITDVSNASSSGLFDPFTLNWSYWPFKLFGIPDTIFPRIVDSAGDHFGSTIENIFGCSIPIHCSIADQSASLFGSCCFNTGDTKVTLGTGTFLDVNTGNKPHASFKGLYPLVAWKFKEEVIYMAEGSFNDTGLLIKWAQELELLNNPGDSAQIAQSVENNNGVYFVPAFSGLQAHIDDADAATGFIGLKLTTKKPHLLRAILESIVYRVFQLFKDFYEETDFTPGCLRFDGGVSSNDFVMQMLADILNLTVWRADNKEITAMGAAFLAGLSNGIWKEKNELYDLIKVTQKFTPCKSSFDHHEKEYLTWCRAVIRFTKWYRSACVRTCTYSISYFKRLLIDRKP